jgi:hypothetical protein
MSGIFKFWGATKQKGIPEGTPCLFKLTLPLRLLSVVTVDEDNFLIILERLTVNLHEADDPVNELPYAAAAYCEELKNAESDLSSEETVNAEAAEEPAEQPAVKMLVKSLFHIYKSSVIYWKLKLIYRKI